MSARIFFPLLFILFSYLTLVKWFIHSNESVRIGFYIFPVPSADFVEHLVDKPHVKGAVQIKHLSLNTV